jgi:hypothetical protein
MGGDDRPNGEESVDRDSGHLDEKLGRLDKLGQDGAVVAEGQDG